MLLRYSHDRCIAMTLSSLFAQNTEVDAAPRLSGVPSWAGPKDDDGDKGAGGGGRGGTETGTATKTRTKTKRPNLYRVLLLNDDYTPMEFVVLVLQDVFNKSREEAMQIMMHVHQKGVGECGVFPYEVAETKVTRVMDTARKNQHPLQCVMEKQ
jgi:ATP-dependent Clp protease adaptor protein ClpS